MMKYDSDRVEQYFPTYRLLQKGNRDIALAEYAAANSSLADEQKLFNASANIVIVVVSVITSCLIGANKLQSDGILAFLSDNALYASLFLFANVFTTLAFLMFLGQRQKEINFAARKVIVLRRLLGLSYGRVHMVLPTWRVEAADEPFSVRPFMGWMQYKNFPAYLISLCSSFLYVYIGGGYTSSDFFLGIFFFMHCTFLIFMYRVFLFDHHENVFLLFSKVLSKVLKLHLVSNFEYIIYRSKLQTHEIHRMNLNCHNVINSLIFLEDRRFFVHGGISYLSVCRALFFRVYKGKKSGASTISQQLARTLFIEDFRFPVRRKLVEAMLSFWLERAFLKQDILYMYIGSVRYEKDTFGILDAMKLFFEKIVDYPSVAQSFFLIERVSNVNSKLLGGKVYVNIRDAKKKGLLSDADVIELLKIYDKQISRNLISEVNGFGISRIREKMNIE